MKIGSMRWIFLILALLAVGQVFWWAHLLTQQGQVAGTMAPSDFTTMIVSEGAFFILVWCVGMWFAYRGYLEQVRLRQTQTDFLSAVTHELKTPIANIRLSLDTLERHPLSPEHQNVYIERAQMACNRLLLQIETILSLNEEGQKFYPPQSFNLENLIQEALQILDLDKDQVPLKAEKGPYQMKGYIEECRLIIQLLLDNAQKYGQNPNEPRTSSPLLEIEILTLQSGHVRLNIRDFGIGMSGSEIRSAFLPFWRSTLAQKSIPGTGIGLSLAKRLSQRMNLILSLESQGIGHGTTASLIFPSSMRDL